MSGVSSATAGVGSFAVAGFNVFAACVSFGINKVPETVRKSLTYFCNKLRQEPRIFLYTPLIFMGDAVRYYGREVSSPVEKWILRAKAVSYTGALGVLTNLPKAIRAISTKIEANGEPIKKRYIINEGGELKFAGKNEPRLTSVETLGRRVYHVAKWSFSVYDAACELSNYYPIPFNRAIGWIPPVVGIVFSSYEFREEYKFLNDPKKGNIHPAEKYHSMCKIAASIFYFVYTLYSTIIVWGVRYLDAGKTPPRWFGVVQILGFTLAVAFPIVRIVMEDRVSQLHKDVKKASAPLS